MSTFSIILVAGARPNFMKIAPIAEFFRARPEYNPIIVHTGQHYDEKMSNLFFRQLGIPEPDVNLGVGSASHALQTAEIMRKFEPIVQQYRPDAVLVVGDVNSTVACGLVTVKLGLKLIHVEAGLRSFDRSMPEEINRLVTDSISDLLFCSEQSGVENLRHEGVAEDKIHLVGNVMIDTLLKNFDKANATSILDDIGLFPGDYCAMTLHRPSNVDSVETLQGILSAAAKIGSQCPVVFPVHPRTRERLKHPSLKCFSERLHLVEPLGYLEFLKLMANAKAVVTDSGGIQEETTTLGVPCLTVRTNTERPVTVELGTNQLVGTKPADILDAFARVAASPPEKKAPPPLWDGMAAVRIVETIHDIWVKPGH